MILMSQTANSYTIHPACAKWPRPSAAEFAALVADIRGKGLLNPIWLMGNEILEGKIRYEACLQAGVEPCFETYTGDDPIGFTISQNKHRRHMSAAQLALIGEELATLKVGRPNNSPREGNKSQAQIAQQLGISANLINDARSLKQHAEHNIVELVRTNQVGIKNAAVYARRTPREEQRAATPKTIKKQGAVLRAPFKNGLAERKSRTVKTDTRKTKATPVITFSSDQIQELIEKLRPFIKRLRVQAKKHIVEFSPMALENIAFDMDKLLDEWTNAETDAARRAPAPSAIKASGN
jgi:hypothetical protein